ncbi:MAG: hypothetical protein K2K32_03275, partial [Muribaculaceae bacterium]|nr:hypothetical protein [Muribaculaceae bacterium]
RLLDALSWQLETWKISIIVRNEPTVDALEYVYIHADGMRVRILSGCQHIQREAPVVRSTMMGNSRASNCKDGQDSTALRFSFY